MSIQFFDCPNCGKSLRVGARSCHHCHAVDENDWADPDQAPEFATGGYGAALDEDDEVHRPQPQWKRTAVIAIILLLILSFILQAFLPNISLL
jgi:endogenous inhibitor of DNA gyrase (YacG/DUF329 family)